MQGKPIKIPPRRRACLILEADVLSTHHLIFYCNMRKYDNPLLLHRIFDGFKLAICDAKVWIFMIMSCAQLLGLSYINFFPT